MFSSNSELTFPCGPRWFIEGLLSWPMNLWLRLGCRFWLPLMFGFESSSSQIPRQKLLAIVSLFFFFLPDIIPKVIFIYISFFLKSMSRVMRRHSALRLQPWLISCFPQETREGRMRRDGWALLEVWNSWLWAHLRIIDLKTGYVLPSVEAGQLWRSKDSFLAVGWGVGRGMGDGASRAFSSFSIPSFQWMR